MGLYEFLQAEIKILEERQKKNTSDKLYLMMNTQIDTYKQVLALIESGIQLREPADLEMDFA